MTRRIRKKAPAGAEYYNLRTGKYFVVSERSIVLEYNMGKWVLAKLSVDDLDMMLEIGTIIEFGGGCRDVLVTILKIALLSVTAGLVISLFK